VPANPPPGNYGIPSPTYGGCDQRPFFFSAELQFLKPEVHNRMDNAVPVPGGTGLVAIPGSSLDFTVAPKIEFGYRLPDTAGQFSIGYRFMDVEGTRTRDTIIGPATSTRSRLDFNEFDFDYATARYEPAPRWYLQWRLGARVTWVYYDTDAKVPGIIERESNDFVGAGPHLGFDAERHFDVLPAFSLFAHLDGAVLIGQDQQHFAIEPFVFTPDRKTLTVPTLQAQLGVGYTPPAFPWLRFRAGYQYEHWFNVGNLGGSHLDMTFQGAFLRGEIDF
jgi:hypothetical protein